MFEWENGEQGWDKVEEERHEFRTAHLEGAGHDELELEFGDVLFSLINYARYAGIDPEMALERVNRKFKSRFEYIEANAPVALNDMTLNEMDQLWNEAKKSQKNTWLQNAVVKNCNFAALKKRVKD